MKDLPEGQTHFADDATLEYIRKMEADLASQAEQVRKLEEKVLRIVRGEFTQICSYCGWESPADGWDELQAHIKVCPIHPLAQANETIAALQARIDGAEKQEPTKYLYKYPFLGGTAIYGELRGGEVPLESIPLFTRPPITSERELELLAVIKQMRAVSNLTVDRTFWLLEKGSPANWITYSENFNKINSTIYRPFEDRIGLGVNRWYEFTADSSKAIKFNSKEHAEERAKDDMLLDLGVIATEHIFVGMPATDEEKIVALKALALTPESALKEHDAKVLEEAAETCDKYAKKCAAENLHSGGARTCEILISRMAEERRR